MCNQIPPSRFPVYEGVVFQWSCRSTRTLRNWSRPTFDGLIFDPTTHDKIVKGKINLWRGWGVEPKQGDWSTMQQHIFEVGARSNTADETYILDWLAFDVQVPNRRAEALLGFIGEKGSGKGTIGNAMCRLHGQHCLHISNSRDLTGNFNIHLRDCCFLFADEAWAATRPRKGHSRG